jgi:hypothetical protein
LWYSLVIHNFVQKSLINFQSVIPAQAEIQDF